MFREKINSTDFSHMPREYQELLTRVLTIQADCEIGGPRVYGARWLLDAPTAEDMYGLAHVISDEIDHFRKINSLLRGINKDGTSLLHKSNSERFLDAFKVTDVPAWADVAVFCFLVDRVGKYQVEEFVDSTYVPLNETIPGIIKEEIFHVSYGRAKVKELCADRKGRVQVQQALNRWYPLALDMFGRSASRRSERYIEWGIKQRTNEEARVAYMEEVAPQIAELGLDVPDAKKDRLYL